MMLKTCIVLFYTDVDECELNMCGDDSISCSNSDGGYTCDCKTGFWFDQNTYGASCKGRNEFLLHN